MRAGVPLTLGLLAAALLLAVPAAAPATFGTYVAVGASHDAGYTNGSLVETHQVLSYPALIARQAGVAGFQLPLVGEPGLPPELVLASLLPSPVIVTKASQAGAPKNLGLDRPYDNLSVPGATSVDVTTREGDQGGLHDLILRGRGTQLAQALSRAPTFVTVGFVAGNDVLGAALRGRAVDGVTMVPLEATRAAYRAIITSLRGAGATVVATNVPDVTALPFVTTLSPYVVNPATGEPVLVGGQRVPLLGPSGPLPQGSYVTLAASSLLAQGIGVPTSLGGRGVALPDEVVLDPAEVGTIRDRVSAINSLIRETCQANSVALVDAHALLEEFSTTGRVVGGVVLSADFLTGGIFGYDGIHFTDLGQAVFANEWIRVINANGGDGGKVIPEVDLGPFLGTRAAGEGLALAAGRRRAPAEMSWEAYEQLLEALPLPGERR